MKKIMAAILCIALALSVMSIGVFAEEVVEPTVREDFKVGSYTISPSNWTVSGVAPLTTVANFKAAFEGSGHTVDVINIDRRTIMADDAYATDNVYARINGEFYNIDVNWPYDSVQYYGRKYRTDGDVIFERSASAMKFTPTQGNNEAMTNSGFAYVQGSYNYKYVQSTAPTLDATHGMKITKQTEKGEPVYVIENNAPGRAVYLRSHYVNSTSDNINNQTELTKATKDKISVTTATFTADKLGTITLYHHIGGYATADSNGKTYKADRPIEDMTYSSHTQYMPNVVHFTEDGKIMVGGSYVYTTDVAKKTPYFDTGYKWEAGKEYTVSVVQKPRYNASGGYGRVYGVYVNGEKVFPSANTPNIGDGFGKESDGSYTMNTRDKGTTYKYYGGISSVMFGTVPVTGEELEVELSDLKVYTIASATDYMPAMDADITLASADPYITIDNDAATVTSSLGAVTADRFAMDGYSVAVQGNVLTVVSADGLTAKKYAVTHGTGIKTGFYNADTDAEITSLAGVTNVGFTAFIDKANSSQFANKTARVYLAVYKNDEFVGSIIATGDIYSGEMTKFTAEYDFSELQTADGDIVTARAFIWDRYSLNPLTESFDIQ